MSAIDLKSISILVVEDEPLLRRQIAAQMERQGADVTTADFLAAARLSFGTAIRLRIGRSFAGLIAMSAMADNSSKRVATLP